MQWLALVTWILVLLLALPTGRVLLPSIGAEILCVLAGLATMAVFAAEGGRVFAWVAFGLACLATVLALISADVLIADAEESGQWMRQRHKESSAGLLGFEVPFLITAALLSVAAIYI